LRKSTPSPQLFPLHLNDSICVALPLQCYFPCNQSPSILFSIALAGRFSVLISTPKLKRCCSYIFSPSQLFPLHRNDSRCVAYYLSNAISLVIGRLLYYFLSLTVMIHVASLITSPTLVALPLQCYFPCNRSPSILFPIAFAGHCSVLFSTPKLTRCCSYIFAPSQLFPLHRNDSRSVTYYLSNAISLVIGCLL